jgi:hypothetical protein
VPNKQQKLAEVIPYRRDNLATALSNPYLSPEEVKTKKIRHYHFLLDYFDEHLGGHHVGTLVIEHKYLSKSYLNDYANFYSTSYVDYKRFCKRIHFFSESFDQRRFDSMILTPQRGDDEIWKTYLGYVVIRPLSRAIIGATLLKPFSENGTGRHYNAIRNYTINLFGKEIKLKTLVFQEQDNVVGACASSALWSAFHKISIQEVFQTPLPSPSEITKSVKSHFNHFSGRIFPNDGLTLDQILESIDAIGLVSELFNSQQIKQPDYLRAIIYAYSKMGLPVLLQFKFENNEHHLVTIAGYREDINIPAVKKKKGLTLTADRLVKFYAHDDQVGPFARLEFAKGAKSKHYPLTTAWVNYDKFIPGSPIPKMLATPEAIIVPVNEKVRVSFTNVYDKLIDIDTFFCEFIVPGHFIVWDFHLEHSNEYKKEIFGDIDDSAKAGTPLRIRRKILKRCFPKYIWVAKALFDGKVQFEFVFDATNVADASFCKFINFYNEDLRKLTRKVFSRKNSGAINSVLENLGDKYLRIISEELK